jgi:excinuclease UvrABC ATPase subunit
VIDLGPEGGARGGKVIIATPARRRSIARKKGSVTGEYLRQDIGMIPEHRIRVML